MSAIYSKLGVRNRTEATNLFHAALHPEHSQSVPGVDVEATQLPAPLNTLTSGEFRILQQHATTKSPQAIAHELGMKNAWNLHTDRIYSRLGVHNRTEATNLFYAALHFYAVLHPELTPPAPELARHDDTSLKSLSHPLRQTNRINRYIALHGPIPVFIEQQGTIQLVFYDIQRGFQVMFKPAPGRAIRRILTYTEEQWQDLLARVSE